MLVPKIATALKDYNREKILGDLTAGVIVGVVGLTGSPVLEEIGAENVFSNLDDALRRARDLLSSPLTPRRIEAMAS